MTDPTADAAKLLSCYYRKKPVVIEAVQFVVGQVLPEWAMDAGRQNNSGQFEINTLEGTMIAQKGDWIIRGVKGEVYPCKHDIFDATYEPENTRPQSAPPVDYDDEITSDDIEALNKIVPDEEFKDFKPAPPEGAPTPPSDMVDVLSRLTNLIENERVRAYNEGYDAGHAARPKVEDAINEIAHTKENADAARIIRGLRNIGAADAIRLIETLGDKLGEERERVVSVGFPNHPLRGGVERVYTLDDIEPLLNRAEAAEAKLAARPKVDAEVATELYRLRKRKYVSSPYGDFDLKSTADLLERVAGERDAALEGMTAIERDVSFQCRRAEAAEAELVKADAVIAFYHDFDGYEGGRSATADEEKWDNEAMERHAARPKVEEAEVATEIALIDGFLGGTHGTDKASFRLYMKRWRDLLEHLAAKLAEADAVIAFYHDFDGYEGGRSTTPDEEKWDKEAMERHAARQQQKD